MTPGGRPFPADVDVAVVSYNGRQTLPRVFACLRDAGVPLERITLYDIASTDDTRAWLAAELPQVQVVTMPTNAGPNPARNRALREATRPYLLLLDSDAYLDADAPALLRTSLGPADVGAATPLVVYEHDPQRIQYGSASLHFLCEAINPWLDRTREERGGSAAHIGTAAGVCFLLDVKAALACGAFDERYFMGKEDGEFCYRLRVAGYRIVEVPRALALHPSKTRSTWLFRHQLRNRWHFILRDYELRTLVVLAPALLLHEPIQFAAVIAKGQVGAWFNAVGDLLSWLPRLPGQRRSVRKMRRTPDSAILGAAPLVVRADVVGGRGGRLFKALYDRWLAAYWAVARTMLR